MEGIPDQDTQPDEDCSKWSLRGEFTTKRRRLLLVEGEDEWHLLIRLLPTLGIEDIDVRSYAGVTKLMGALDAIRANRGFHFITSVSVWRDAETSADAASGAVKGALGAAGFGVPEASGQFINGDHRVGFLILPDGVNAGSLEDICLAAVSEDPVMPCVDAYRDCLHNVAADASLDLHPNEAKIRLHTFLASRPVPGMQLGMAANAGYVNFDHPAWDRITSFLQSM